MVPVRFPEKGSIEKQPIRRRDGEDLSRERWVWPGGEGLGRGGVSGAEEGGLNRSLCLGQKVTRACCFFIYIIYIYIYAIFF